MSSEQRAERAGGEQRQTVCTQKVRKGSVSATEAVGAVGMAVQTFGGVHPGVLDDDSRA